MYTPSSSELEAAISLDSTLEVVAIDGYPIIDQKIYLQLEKEFWEITDTITEQSYATHNYIRYYGKFIPEIAKQLIARFTEVNDVILDNMAGSGTTLVEAMLAGRRSVGVDISPLASLSCKVKTTLIDPSSLRHVLQQVKEHLQLYSRENVEKLTFKSIDKWFSPSIQYKMAYLKDFIWSIDDDDIRDFFKLAFGSIVRRVSLAYDGEVRPHINLKKRQQDPFVVFKRKSKDMISRMTILWSQKSQLGKCRIYCEDATVTHLHHPDLQESVKLVISHPPYLNAFNYAHALSLVTKYMGFDYDEISKQETKVHPATNMNRVLDFFDFMHKSMESAYQLLVKGGYLAIIIGDCTVRDAVIHEHRRLLELGRIIGFTPIQVIFRKPLYSTGAYSYQHRVYKYERILILQK